jgi:hypothetical protein
LEANEVCTGCAGRNVGRFRDPRQRHGSVTRSEKRSIAAFMILSCMRADFPLAKASRFGFGGGIGGQAYPRATEHSQMAGRAGWQMPSTTSPRTSLGSPAAHRLGDECGARDPVTISPLRLLSPVTGTADGFGTAAVALSVPTDRPGRHTTSTATDHADHRPRSIAS